VTGETVPTTPRGAGRRSGRLRWTIAISIVAIVAVISAAGIFVLSGAGGAAKSLTAGNAPADTVLFVDLRTDLPGDQHQKLADFMTHFPGFKDRAQFDNAFDELLNRLSSQISPEFTYTSAFKAWTSGEISIAVTRFEAVSGLLGLGSPQGALIVSLKDKPRAERWVASEVKRTGLTFSPSEYAGTTLYGAGSGSDRVAYAFTDKVFIAGSYEAVTACLDAPADGSLADSEVYRSAMDALGGDRVAAFYANPQALLVSEAESLAAALGPFGDLIDTSSLVFANVPAWTAGSVRAESDRMIVEARIPKTADSPNSGNRESALAGLLPGSTVAAVELRSISTTATELFDIFGGPGASDQQRQVVSQIVETLKGVGGVDWIGDSALVVTKTSSGYGGGIVVVTPDAQTAAGKKALFANLGVLAGPALGLTGISVSQTEWTYKGTGVTRLTISGDPVGQLTIDLAAHDDLLIAGTGEDFMKQMLDTTPGSSLAAQEGYKRAVGASGMSNSGFGYADVAAVVDDIGRAALAPDPGVYDLEIAPYLENLSWAAGSAIDGQTVILRLVVLAR
jgi:hypothetical protein